MTDRLGPPSPDQRMCEGPTPYRSRRATYLSSWCAWPKKRPDVFQGRHREEVKLSEVGPQESAPVLREYLRQAKAARSSFDASPDSGGSSDLGCALSPSAESPRFIAPLPRRQGGRPSDLRRRAQAGQCDRNPVGPRVDRRPVVVVAKAAAEGVEEHARPERPLVLVDDALEDAILAPADLGTNLPDPLGLLVGQRADQALPIAERSHAEEPERASGESIAVSGNERVRLGPRWASVPE